MTAITYYVCLMMALSSFSSSLQMMKHVNAFSAISSIPTKIIQSRSRNSKVSSLSGLLDDVMAEKEEEESVTTTSSEQTTTTTTLDQDEHEDFMYSLVFSSNTARDIESQFEKSTDPNFGEYLSTKITNSEDEEERQGLQELMDLIETVKSSVVVQAQKEAADAAALQARNEEEKRFRESTSTQNNEEPIMSNTDVLKEANAIDKGVISAAMSDDEKPSDFISDCREVVNLSGGFNNKGRMRVGGQ